MKCSYVHNFQISVYLCVCQLSHNIARGNLQKNSIFKDIVQIEVAPPLPIFDKFIFDTVLIMLTTLPPLEFLTQIMKF